MSSFTLNIFLRVLLALSLGVALVIAPSHPHHAHRLYLHAIPHKGSPDIDINYPHIFQMYSIILLNRICVNMVLLTVYLSYLPAEVNSLRMRFKMHSNWLKMIVSFAIRYEN